MTMSIPICLPFCNATMMTGLPSHSAALDPIICIAARGLSITLPMCISSDFLSIQFATALELKQTNCSAGILLE